jgi:hypothetical protein
MKSIWDCPRRDMCFNVGARAARLPPDQAVIAWRILARRMEEMQDKDIPKFADLIISIRAATIASKTIEERLAPEYSI